MTPQVLMDLPYAGMAEKELRKQHQWELTRDEKLSQAISRMRDAIEDLDDEMYDLEKLTQ